MSTHNIPTEGDRMFPEHRVPDHVIVWSFNDDADAYAFNDWWLSAGRDLFIAELENNQ